LDLLAGRPPRPRVDDGDFDGADADRLERVVPGRGARQGEARRDGAAQVLILDVRDCREYQHSPTRPPKIRNCRKNALRCRKNALNAPRSTTQVGSACESPSNPTVEAFMSRRIRF